MKLWQAEKQAFEELESAETLGDIMRIGFNRVDFTDKTGKHYELYELTGGEEISGNTWGEDYKMQAVKISANIAIDSDSVEIDRDEDQYTTVSVNESED